MSVPSVPGSAAGRPRRSVLTAGLVVLLLIPLVFVFGLSWRFQASQVSFTAEQRHGVDYLGPLTELTSVATDAQSAAIHGQDIDTGALQVAIAAVDAVNKRLGGNLRATQRWNAARVALLALTSRKAADPEQAYTDYSEMVDQLVALARKIGDTSNLILNPDIDAYYVMNAVLLRIPQLVVDSARYSDLLYLATRTSAPVPVPAQRLAQLAVARNRIASGAEDVADGLEKAFKESSSRTLASSMVRQLDDFRTSVDFVAPTTSLLTTDNSVLTATGSDAAVEAAGTLRRALVELDRVSLSELKVLYSRQISAQRQRQALSIVGLVVGILLTGLAVTWLDPSRRPDRPRWVPRGMHRTGPRSDFPGLEPEFAAVGAGSADPGGARASR